MTQRKIRYPRVSGVPALIAVAVIVAGCGADGGRGAAAPDNVATTTSTTASSTKPATSARPSTTTRTTSSPAWTSATAQPIPLCKAGDLKLSLGRGDAGAGTVWRPLRFTNSSDHKCELQGFPGVSYVAGDDGHQVGAAAYRDGYKGAALLLAPGKTAHAPVGFINVDNYDPADCKPTSVRGLRVYPPQETNAMYLPNPGRGCANPDVADYHLKVRTMEPGAG